MEQDKKHQEEKYRKQNTISHIDKDGNRLFLNENKKCTVVYDALKGTFRNEYK